MSNLQYRAGVHPNDLQPGECVVRPCSDARGRFWWLTLAFTRRDAGERDWVGVPVTPRGPGDKTFRLTWGLTEVGGGVWQISPSIRTTEKIGGAEVEIYHETPRIVGVPATEPWAMGHAP